MAYMVHNASHNNGIDRNRSTNDSSNPDPAFLETKQWLHLSKG